MNRFFRTPQLSSFLWRAFNLTIVVALLVSLSPASQGQLAKADSNAPDAATFNSLSLSGTDTYIRVPNHSELNNLSAITIEAWVFRNNTGRYETIVGNGWQTSYWFGFSPSGKLRFMAHGGDAVDSNTTVSPGSWNHVAVTYNGLQRFFYINGGLDKSTTASSGAILPNPSDPLGIGYDADPLDPNYFDGAIDDVRVWNEVRSADEIQANMFYALSSPYPSSLIAYWKLDGNANDATGGHPGTLQAGMGYTWVNNGGLPHDIRIPQIETAPVLDGTCGATEYPSAMVVSVEGTLISLQHTPTDLWVCFNFGTISNYTRTSLLLDPDHDRLDPAQPDDFRFDINNSGELETFIGDGLGFWILNTNYATQWDGEWHVTGGEFPNYSAEYRITEGLAGGWGSVIGLALDPYIPGYGGIDSIGMWPARSTRTRPSTWSSSTLAGTGPTRTYKGTVEYQPKNLSYPSTGVNGAKVELYGYDAGGSEALVATGNSWSSGAFSITTNDDYTRHRLELAELPQGYTSTGAEAPSPGLVIDTRTIEYGSSGGGTYPNNIFTLGNPVPYNSAAPYGPVFLIVAPQAVIDAGALDEFTAFKLQQGFAISVRSIEYADAHYSGATRLERTRAMEQDYLQQYGARFQYVMLVGGNDVIPYGKITAYALGNDPICPSETPINYKFSDWLYVDLTSNPDTNGNGCAIDGSLSDPSKRVAGYSPDAFAFDPAVALGRIPFSDQNIVRQVLKNSIGFEKQSESYKWKALTGLAMVALKGYYNGGSCSGHWSTHCVPPDPNNVTNYDMSLLAEEMQNDFLDDNAFTLSKQYENEETIAGGQGIITNPSLTLGNVLAALDAGRFGLSVISGHGNSSADVRTFWESDKNGNGVVDVTDDPNTTELASLDFFNTSGVLDQTDPEGSRGSIYILLACSNADPNDASNLAATILADGHGPASVAAMNTTTVSSWFTESNKYNPTIGYYVVQRLVDRSYRMGESVWWTLADLIQEGKAGSGGVGYDLFGDPTLSFYGNPGGETDLDPWPMGRRDGSGASTISLQGPSTPKMLWEYNTGLHGGQTYGPTALVSANGEVVAAAETYVDVIHQGTLYQRLQLDDWVFGSPALAADGTIYVMDQGANLYAFPNKRITINGITILMNERVRRWKVDLGDNPQASPVIGSDGYILAGVGGPYAEDPRIWIVRPDGEMPYWLDLDALPVNYAAVDASRTIYVTAEGMKGRLYHFVPFCDVTVPGDVCASPNGSYLEVNGNFTTSPLIWKGSVYAGAAPSTLYRVNKDTLAIQAQFTADSTIKLGPVGSPNGDVVFVTTNGILYSLTPDLATVRWQVNLGTSQLYGIPAASNNAIYLAFGDYLRAYNPSSGAEIWKVSLGGEIEAGSVSIGYGREIYVQGAAGQKVLAYNQGWGIGPASVAANVGSQAGRKFVDVEVLRAIAPITTTLATEPGRSALLGTSTEIERMETESVGEGNQPTAASIISILVQRSENSGPWEDFAVLSPDQTIVRDTSILPDVDYAYRAQYLLSDGNNSEFTGMLEILHSLPDVPGAPTLDSAVAISSEAIQVSWTPNPASIYDQYLVERALANAGPYVPIDTLTGASHTLVDPGLSPATTYYYRVSGINEGGQSAPSNVRSATTYKQTFGAPQNFQAELTDANQVILTWTPGPAGANAVLEVISMGEADYRPLTEVLASNGAYNYFTGEPGAYGYRIKYVAGSNESAYTYSSTDVTITIRSPIYLPMIVR